ncbi:hypothetical protein PVAND_001007 [Polypedilum vanderplanki]|uniref:Peptidase S1 domain-containing protein n=1 Tax=Polypedilum vanderplanki TaxID=319348 RepID=A0A9J6BMX7_POLVA|nr:hypothetical protein PVAND_001007 [Polypedilum vanderplanki]
MFKIQSVLMILLLSIYKLHSQISDCIFPNSIKESRENRLHHSCEQNRNQYFAIEFNKEDNFYCIYYSSIETSLFGSERLELTIDNDFEIEQNGAEDFSVNISKVSFNVLFNDVTLKILRKSNKIPQISSVIVNNEEYCERQHCGIRSEAIPIIIGGNKVREGSWPWHSAIYYRPYIGTLNYRCGATIVNKKTVITTASCLVTYDASVQDRVKIKTEKLSVGVGETILYDSSAANRQILEVDEMKLHEMYKIKLSTDDDDGYKDDYNVALLILKNEIKYSLHVQPICLPSYTDDEEFDYDNQIGKVVGWGFTEDNGFEISRNLQDLTVSTNNFLTCMFRAVNRTLFLGFSASRNFCAGFQNNRGICTGDAGGGLYMEVDSKFHIFGLAYHANCECNKKTNKCRVFNEGIFVNLIEFMQWIHNNIY